ncbi:MAG TPA: SpoIIIAH-like family protein [Clostridiales bacterium]|nr:SpoIIIAH-like family protein [Clostridiales bacterium]
MFIKRKTMIIVALVLMIGIAGYLNYSYNRSVQTVKQGGEDIDFSSEAAEEPDALDDVIVEDKKTEEADEREVISQQQTTSSFFIDYRLERDKVRSEQIEYLKEVIDNKDTVQEIRNEAQREMVAIVKMMEKELAVENLLKAKGFRDALIFIHENSINVIVDEDNLTPEQVAQIQDIVIRETGEKLENIKIMEDKHN